MAAKAEIFLGFDPGGQNKFGIAILDGNEIRASACGISEAISWARSECENRIPVAAGIDTLLHWTSAPSGLREADLWLRANYPNAKRSVVSPNALYGAMVIGGMGLALELRRLWPSILLNETHPKMLYRCVAGSRYSVTDLHAAVQWFVGHSNVVLIDPISNDHAFDAALSAWATRQGYESGWQDLVIQEANPIFPAGEVNYLWPPVKK